MSITKLSNSGLAGDKYTSVMADNTYMEPIATTLVGAGGSASVTFSNIPQNYKHLQIRGIARSTIGAGSLDSVKLNINGDLGGNYMRHVLQGDGATVTAAASATGATYAGIGESTSATTAANIFTAYVVDILDYTNQNKYKTLRNLGGYDANGSGTVNFRSNLYLSTSTITSITLAMVSANFAQYTRFSLYGVRG